MTLNNSVIMYFQYIKIIIFSHIHSSLITVDDDILFQPPIAITIVIH